MISKKGKTHTYTIDPFGNVITSATMAGDHRRQRHDRIKQRIKRLSEWAEMPIQFEVLHLFASVISQYEKLTTEKAPRQIQGIIPDIYNCDDQTLLDIKTMSCCKTHYKPCRSRNAIRSDAVRVRQAKVHTKYTAKAHDIDVEYNDYKGKRSLGPVGLKLSSFGRVKGLACGAFGEGSADLHDLCGKLPESAALNKYSDMGAASAKDAKSRATRYVYRLLGIEMMRSISTLRPYRLAMALAGSKSNREAAARRKWSRVAFEKDCSSYFDKHSYGTTCHARPW